MSDKLTRKLHEICWAEIQQLALIRLSSSLHSEACNALGASDGVIHSTISLEVACFWAAANDMQILSDIQREARAKKRCAPMRRMLTHFERWAANGYPADNWGRAAFMLGRSPHKNCKNDLDDQT